MEYKEFTKDLDKKIWKWNYAIPLELLPMLYPTY